MKPQLIPGVERPCFSVQLFMHLVRSEAFSRETVANLGDPNLLSVSNCVSSNRVDCVYQSFI